jgi:hypothetical protein
MMGMVDITALHALGRGESELSPSLETKSSLLFDSSRMACSDGDPLWAMPPTVAPESSSLSGRLKLLEQLAMDYGASKWMAYVLRKLNAERRWVLPVAMVGLHR